VDSELPLLTLEQETGVKRQSIMRFLRGERSLRLDIADKLAAHFELELKSSSRRKAK
jgi:plasmid maintenance system antidote protein VapI|tara:strand:+ start:1256 stop:1426 length:171 start_codon:yes stop_codon:yes gene_type:complete